MYGKGCEYKDNDCKRVALTGLFRKLSKELSHGVPYMRSVIRNYLNTSSYYIQTGSNQILSFVHAI